MESKKVHVLKALDVCSDFAGDPTDIRPAMKKIKVTNEMCEATNAHVMIRIEVRDTLLPKGKVALVDTKKARTMAALSMDDVVNVKKLFSDIGDPSSFPDTAGALSKTESEPVVVRIGIAPAYLEVIGKAFRELGADYVELVIRGKEVGMVCNGIDGNNHVKVGTAVVMPMRMYHPE